MIELNNVTIQKGKRTIFDNVNLTFEPGKSYALIGHSGSGKSTLLNAIAGFETLKQGEVRFDQKRLKADFRFYRDILGYVFQNYGLVDSMTINQNLDMALAFKKGSRSGKKQLKTHSLQKVGLDIEGKRKVATLSGGEQQRVALARLLLKQPRLILADEPTGSLDDANGQKVVELLFDMVDDTRTLIIATHDLTLAQQCDEIIQVDALKCHSSALETVQSM
ncbi:ATP-binding cassette domain-containing protein [Staphylococcus delphini]|uniref:ATP-binding cassette domain-containing protein n=1 Tax=Staphylococcus delphini TaxID=53344 RepID=UPI000BBC972D|nr:ATP-binding cassette domain-containing protein [Staphylococcus delphini]PCF41345.1 bacteriocin ABC transporter ATP-binding protein [Staphylococcus delphini]PCF52509.1 bacteriocin ABC transporter ATP-binding protein [Staphylococcus delphini]PCF57491.1 bacteriocin ABC transporter ATP-binding protein [Staphylococcus delphini]PCF59517.1 bacteriocin ABC transporter ATP-binding protein [Staphylococcus delphini]